MRRHKVDSSLERLFCIGLITSKPFLLGAVGLLETESNLIDVPYVRQIAKWSLTHYRQYKEPAGRSIEAVYHAWVANENPPDHDAEAVGDFLGSLSDQYDEGERLNHAHLLDQLSRYLTLKKVTALKETLESHLMYGETEKAVAAIDTFTTVSLKDGEGYHPLNDRSVTRRTYAEAPEPLLHFPGAAEEFFGPVITRDTLIGIQGPEKRGKTWWCLEFVYRALRERRKVAMFEVGDLSEVQLNKRMDMRASGIPLWASQCRAGVRIPSRIELEDDGEGGREPKVAFTTQTFSEPINFHSACKGKKRFLRRHKLRGDELMFSVHANSSINVAGIDTILRRWRDELQYVPDIILIDYADILAPENPKLEFRHQVNETWKALRRLSQDWHACVIVPTQANASSYQQKTQSMRNFSEDKRKLAHVTAMLGLNQTEKEYAMQVMRLNWLVLRESEAVSSRCLWVAQCLPLGQALVKATW